MRALIVHLAFESFGGAEMYCMRVANVLQRRFGEVTILHFGPSPDLGFVEMFTNVRLDPQKVKFLSLPIPRIASRHSLLLHALIVRQARKIAAGYDFCVSTFAETPLPGIRMIQSVHIPLLSTDRDILSYCGMTGLTPLRRLLQAAYVKVVWMVLGGGKRYVRDQCSVTNSEWTREQFLKVYPGGNVVAIHSGVRVKYTPSTKEWTPFERRENNLILLGRITPAKRIEFAIEVVEGLRRLGRTVGLRIAGNVDDSYRQEFLRLLLGRPWIAVHSGLDRDGVEKLLMQQKWGLHCYQFEHYGLAPAELQALGCITFVHDSGGQREIIRDSRQRYSDLADAIGKIDAVMRSPSLQQELLAKGVESAAMHTVARFEEAFDATVDRVMKLPALAR